MCKARTTVCLTLVLACAVLPFFSRERTRAAPIGKLAAVDAFVQEQMRANRVPGVSIGIVEGNEVVYLRGFGTADPEDREVTAQTPFIIGSMSKAFTALAVMQLVEAGKLDLDAPVVQYVPWFSMADTEASARIKVRHLLNHTSGIPNIVGLRQCVGTGESTIEERVRDLSTVSPVHQAGARFQYCNANYTVLGLLVETVSGESYGRYVRSRIFESLDMRNSYVSETEAQEHGLATGYRRWFGFPVPADVPYLRHGIPSGYIISTARDMSHFLLAHINAGRYGNASVLSPEGIAELHKPETPAGDADYGKGWVIGFVDGQPAIYHHGSTANFHSTMLIEPEARRGIVVLTNVSILEVWHLGVSRVIAEGIAALLKGSPPADYGMTVGTRYLIADVVIAVLTAFVVLFVVWVPRWHRRCVEQPPHTALTFARRVVLPVAVDLTWSLTILTGFPAITNLPSWSFWTLYQPDLSYWLLALAAVTVVKGLVRLGLILRARGVVAGRLEARRIVLSVAVVEILYVGLFFLVMFAAVDPATFVIGVLVVALVLESLAYPVRLVDRCRRRAA